MGNSQQVLSQQCRMKEKWIKQNLAAHTFLKYVEEYLPVSAQSSEGADSQGVPVCKSTICFSLSSPLWPLPAIPENTKLSQRHDNYVLDWSLRGSQNSSTLNVNCPSNITMYSDRTKWCGCLDLDEVKLCMDSSTLMLHVWGLYTQMLRCVWPCLVIQLKSQW